MIILQIINLKKKIQANLFKKKQHKNNNKYKINRKIKKKLKKALRNQIILKEQILIKLLQII